MPKVNLPKKIAAKKVSAKSAPPKSAEKPAGFSGAFIGDSHVADAIEVGVQIKVTRNYCSVGTHAVLRTASKEYLPNYSDKDGVKKSIQRLFDEVSGGLDKASDDIVQAVKLISEQV